MRPVTGHWMRLIHWTESRSSSFGGRRKNCSIQSRCFQLSYYIFSSLITFIIASAVRGGNEQSDGWWRFDDETTAQRLSLRCFFSSFYSFYFFLKYAYLEAVCSVQPVRKAFTFSVFSHFSYFIFIFITKTIRWVMRSLSGDVGCPKW